MSNELNEQERRNQAVLQALAARQSASPPAVPLEPAPPGDLFVPVTTQGQPEDTGERTGRLSLAAWVLIDAVFALILTLMLTLVAVPLYALARGITDVSEVEELIKDPNFFFIAVALQSVAFVVIVLLRIMVLRRLPLAWLGIHSRSLLRAVGWGTLAGIAFLAVNLAMGLVFRFFGSEPDQAAQFPTEGASPFQLGLIGLAIVVGAPLVEELFFRGYALRAFSQRLGERWGLILSAALFAGPHVFGITTGYVGLLVPIFFGGLILGYVYQRTGSLWSPIVAHAINNGVAFAALLAQPYLPQ